MVDRQIISQGIVRTKNLIRVMNRRVGTEHLQFAVKIRGLPRQRYLGTSSGQARVLQGRWVDIRPGGNTTFRSSTAESPCGAIIPGY
jgi:hypothetical protein